MGQRGARPGLPYAPDLSRFRSLVNEADFVRIDHGLDAVAQAELGEHPPEVGQRPLRRFVK